MEIQIDKTLKDLEEWKDIPNMKFHYQASNLGRIARVLPSGKRVMLKEWRTEKGYKIKLFEASGRRVQKNTITWIGETWIGRKEGYIFSTKNGVQTDRRVSNITLIKRSESMSKQNKGKRKAVMKINTRGEVVEIYPSLVEAEKHSFLCKSAIAKRCRGKCDNIISEDGFAYCYEDNEEYLKELSRIFGREI